MGLEDSGNILLLEHINLNVSQPAVALIFYLEGLGCVQDPRRGEVVGGKVYANKVLWLNAGINQFHLPITTRGSGGAETNLFTGTIGLSYENLGVLATRLENIVDKLKNTSFSWQRHSNAVEITGPFGNKFMAHCSIEKQMYKRDTRGYHPGETSFCLGIPYVEMLSPIGSSSEISLFYTKYLGAKVTEEQGLVRVSTGPSQELRFRESSSAIIPGTEDYCKAIHGFHIAVYLNDHMGSMKRLAQENLLWGNPRFAELDGSLGLSQFRFKNIIDSKVNKKVIMELEHEVRGLEHASSPFSHTEPYLLSNRVPVPAIINSVTSDYEKDFNSIREANMATKKGFIPNPFSN